MPLIICGIIYYAVLLVYRYARCTSVSSVSKVAPMTRNGGGDMFDGKQGGISIIRIIHKNGDSMRFTVDMRIQLWFKQQKLRSLSKNMGGHL